MIVNLILVYTCSTYMCNIPFLPSLFFSHFIQNLFFDIYIQNKCKNVKNWTLFNIINRNHLYCILLRNHLIYEFSNEIIQHKNVFSRHYNLNYRVINRNSWERFAPSTEACHSWRQVYISGVPRIFGVCMVSASSMALFSDPQSFT